MFEFLFAFFRNISVIFAFDPPQFYLQDTKSSNGTFINNQRLCKGGEESPARDLYSGDLIQFGVEVMENNRRGEKSEFILFWKFDPFFKWLRGE